MLRSSIKSNASLQITRLDNGVAFQTNFPSWVFYPIARLNEKVLIPTKVKLYVDVGKNYCFGELDLTVFVVLKYS